MYGEIRANGTSVTYMRKPLLHSVIILYIICIITVNSMLIRINCSYTFLLFLQSYNILNGLQIMYGENKWQ